MRVWGFLLSWLLEIIAWIVKGIFILLSKARLHFIKKGIKIQNFKILAKDDELYPCLFIQLDINCKTDARVNVKELFIKVKCGKYDLGTMTMKPTIEPNGLPGKIGNRHDHNGILLKFHPPLFFWLQPSNKAYIDGQLLIYSIWGSSVINFLEPTPIEIAHIIEVSKRFRNEFKALIK